MKRVVSVWCPRWAVDVYRRRLRARGTTPARDEPAVILVRQEGQRRVVWGCCARASAAGVRRGMPVADARAAMPAVGTSAPGACVVAEATPAADAAALRALAGWAQRFSPWVSVDGEDGLLLDATGCEGVFGSERGMAGALLAGLRRLRIEARVALACTIGAAWGAARFGAGAHERGGAGPVVIEPGEARIEAALAPLPVAALRLEREVIDGLGEIGITRVGEVLALPRSVLPARFGGVVLRRVDEALGRVPEVLDPMREEAAIEASIVFDGPTTSTEAVSRAVREVVEGDRGVCAQLRARERGARVLRVELTRAGLSPAVLEVVLSRPSRDGKHLRSLLAPRLERVEMGFGIEGVHARVARSGPIGHRQTAWSGGPGGVAETGDGASTEEAIGMLVDTLANRLGAARVGRVRLSPSHRPERAHAIAMGPEVTAGVRADGAGGVEHPAMPRGDRPTRMLAWAEPVEVGLAGPDGPVAWVKRGGADAGGMIAAVATLGPERIAPPWWRPAERESGMPGGATRDYFKVQVADGRWWWLCRAVEDGRWFVHGEWA